MSCSVSQPPSAALFIPPDVRMEQLVQCYNKMNEIRKKNTRRINKYRQSKIGRERTRIANKKYYYRKNDKYHPELNPEGSKGRPPVPELNTVEETPEIE
jgi:hypothetical protein